jgi:hypothetical protein
VSPSDELDELYAVKPDGFTALRTKLAAAAKRRGDTSAAKRISAARKPTTAAWIVNRLTLRHKEVKQRLTELGDRLRAAHTAMDGDRIRSLSMEQHELIDELTRAAFDAAELKSPSGAVRDDVIGTLQAAIADPDVRAALGRLAKAERWSGFGAFGEAAPVSVRGDTKKATKKAAPKDNDAARRQLDELRAAVAAAEHAKAEADHVLTTRQDDLSAARSRHDEARRNLRVAERDLSAAEKAYDKARQATRDAAVSVKEAKARLREQR